jgi:hypothetical protein
MFSRIRCWSLGRKRSRNARGLPCWFTSWGQGCWFGRWRLGVNPRRHSSRVLSRFSSRMLSRISCRIVRWPRRREECRGLSRVHSWRLRRHRSWCLRRFCGRRHCWFCGRSGSRLRGGKCSWLRRRTGRASHRGNRGQARWNRGIQCWRHRWCRRRVGSWGHRWLCSWLHRRSLRRLSRCWVGCRWSTGILGRKRSGWRCGWRPSLTRRYSRVCSGRSTSESWVIGRNS